MVSSSAVRVTLLLAMVSAAAAQPSVLLDTMSRELNRNFTVLKEKADPPPYFLSYEVSDEESRTVTGTLGAISRSDRGRERVLDVSVRVGSRQLDNYRQVRGMRGQSGSGALLPIEDNANAIQNKLWQETDRAYRNAAERLIRIKTNSQVQVAAGDGSDDFSVEQPVVAEETPPRLRFDEAGWTERIRKLSSHFRDYPEVLTSQVTVNAQTDTRYFVNTEGSRVVQGRGYARIIITASAKAADGTDLSTSETFEAVEPSGLPKD
ncbi:MAG TPA: hypothetical protein VJ732_00935, partial [Bryobacteraceae bacterium]|nr:hypothetical protein [Bryobacteraceae bacterium]